MGAWGDCRRARSGRSIISHLPSVSAVISYPEPLNDGSAYEIASTPTNHDILLNDLNRKNIIYLFILANFATSNWWEQYVCWSEHARFWNQFSIAKYWESTREYPSSFPGLLGCNAGSRKTLETRMDNIQSFPESTWPSFSRELCVVEILCVSVCL
jgi:hypothetical protein